MAELKKRRARRAQASEPPETGRRSRSDRNVPALRPRRPGAGKSRSRVIPQRKDPPVLARDYSASTASTVTRGVKPRRRYDLSLSASGAEVRLPSLPRPRLGWRLVSFFLVLGLAGLLYGAWTAPQFRVRAAQVQGLQRLTAREVNSALGISGQPVFTLDRDDLERRLQAAFPEFSAVAVEIELPAEVRVTVEERIPLLVWQQGDRLLLVDEEGMAFPARNTLSGMPEVRVIATELPLLEGGSTSLNLEDLGAASEEAAAGLLPGRRLQAEHLLSPELVAAALDVAPQVPAQAPLVYDNIHGLGWNDPAGWTVYLGTAETVEMKLNVYRALVDHLQAEELQPALISVEFVHAPYYRLNPD